MGPLTKGPLVHEQEADAPSPGGDDRVAERRHSGEQGSAIATGEEVDVNGAAGGMEEEERGRCCGSRGEWCGPAAFTCGAQASFLAVLADVLLLRCSQQGGVCGALPTDASSSYEGSVLARSA
ncbi:hypothetical protein KSZ_56530 [Dictyobacter formicarum]|uniref:Uncharacterized protein n=1 Tax=Dictyobacter formicarum TaxID=2778368 RepID=A0ABQ3VN31_9CHLR|nr:hypothetical protein KSZ_56530 [Dictyobacter formicarum]